MALQASTLVLLMLHACGPSSVWGRRTAVTPQQISNLEFTTTMAPESLIEGDQSELETNDTDITASVMAFHINLAWECAALPPFGSGKIASFHCAPGTLTKQKKLQYKWNERTDWSNPMPKGANGLWKPLEDANESESYTSLVSSCTYTFLKKMTEWHKHYDVITMVELPNPGVVGLEHLGRSKETLPLPSEDGLLNGQQQMDPIAFEYLKEIMEEDYDVFANVLVGNNVVLQATYWRKSTYPSLTAAVGANMMVGDDRPISALFFKDEKTLIVNVHSIHFRKQLIQDQNKEPEDRSFEQENIDLYGDSLKKDNYGIQSFDTRELRKLYGAILTNKFRAALKQCGNPTTGIYCKGNIADLGDLDTLEQTLKDWTIIVGGDFNDETMELSEFELFGISVSVPDAQRKRTCCSDRDRDFKQASSKDGKYNEEDAPFQEAQHTKANLDYLANDCKYLDGKDTGDRESRGEDLQKYINAGGLPNPMLLTGAEKIIPGQKKSWSFSPFSSDMILSNRVGSAIEFPRDYKQKLSQRKASVPELEKNYQVSPGDYDGMISDHDPIWRKISVPSTFGKVVKKGLDYLKRGIASLRKGKK